MQGMQVVGMYSVFQTKFESLVDYYFCDLF